MKKTLLILALLALSLAACAPVVQSTPTAEEVSAPVENLMPVPGSDVPEMIVEPQGKLPAPSFESQVYLDEVHGFALDYPAGWVVQQTMLGERGSQSVLLSAPEIADLAEVPAGETRLAITLYRWDPQNDLAAFVDSRKAAWDASGFVILEEESLTLELGLSAVGFLVQTPGDALTVPFLFAAVGDQYLSLSGEGDLALIREIILRLRPIG